MPNTGSDLIAAIVGNDDLMALDNCPGVPAQMSKAVYHAAQSDSGSGIVIQPGSSMSKQINKAVGFGGSNEETAVWHFLVNCADSGGKRGAVHHFVAVPWYRYGTGGNQGRVFTLLMAYEDQYTVGAYVRGSGKAPDPAKKGYKKARTASDLSTMLSDLLTSGTAWQDYFGDVGANQANKITCWQYKTIRVSSAITNVGKY